MSASLDNVVASDPRPWVAPSDWD